MSKIHRHRRLLYILVAILFLAPAASIFVKIRFLGFSFDSGAGHYYLVDATISYESDPDSEAEASLALPEITPGYRLVAVDDGGFRVGEVDGFRRAVRRTPPGDDRRNLMCRFQVLPGFDPAGFEAPAPPADEEVPPASDEFNLALAELWGRVDPAGDLDSELAVQALLRELAGVPPSGKALFAGRTGGESVVDAAANILPHKGLPARVLRGIDLDEKRARQQPVTLLDVYCHGEWHVFSPVSGQVGLPEDFLVLQRGGKSLYEVSGGRDSRIYFAVTAVPAGAERLNRMRAELLGERVMADLSIFSLPASEQNMFKRLVLLPLAILLIVFARNVIGIRTMGTFMPVLIAMAFLETRLVPGLISFGVILGIGLAIRAWLSRLNLLMVPRISAVVVVVILLMQAIGIAANCLHEPDFMRVTFFPLIIIAWTIERASTIWEEDGARNTVIQLAGSVGAGVVSYLVLSSSYLQYVLYTFSEINFSILGVILMLGTYTGYRLTELIRFEPLVKQ